MKIWGAALHRRHKGFRAYEAGRGRPVCSGLETPRPRGARENRIFILKNAFETPFLAEKPRQS
jgi:hypothetical protein